MVEMGVALVVACLPTLRPLFHGFSAESVVRSARSKLSLQSLRSKPSATDDKGDDKGDDARRSYDSHAAFKPKSDFIHGVPESDEYLETHIMADLETNASHNQLTADRINIRNDLTQSARRV
jgi:hypothetical protein